MGYHYRESGDNGWDILVVTKKGMEEGGLPKGIILLTGILYAERNPAGNGLMMYVPLESFMCQ